MKTIASEFWIGSDGNRVKANQVRSTNFDIEEFRGGLSCSINTSEKDPETLKYVAEISILVISREVTRRLIMKCLNRWDYYE